MHPIIQSALCWGIKNVWFNPLLLIYILMNTVKNLTSNHFLVKLDRCVGSCNKVCVPNKTEDLNLRVFNMITGRNELKTLTKHIS